jgi:biopolymer transport protein ExbB
MSVWIPLLQVAEGGTMVLLFLLSVFSIGILLDRRRVFRRLADPAEFSEAERAILSGGCREAEGWSRTHEGLVGGLLRTICGESTQSSAAIEALARSYLQKERQKLEKGLNVLATLGSNAPFIGLFGTVLGIIRAFAALSAEQTGSGEVMSSISQALIATAAGLFVAVPAVIAYNHFSSRLRHLLLDCESLKNLYLSKLPRGS